MSWGTVVVESEVEQWFLSLPPASASHVAYYIDLLEKEGGQLGEPYTRQLRGKLRELRFSIEGRPIRVTYFIRSGRRIVLLTVFRKTRRRERGEIRRAMRAMARCMDEDDDAREGSE